MRVKEVNLQVAVANKNVVTLQDIEACILRITGYDMKQRNRGRAFVNARALFYYLASHYTACNISEIARHVGMNHASVIHHLKHAPYTIPQDPELQVWYDYITAYLNELVHNKSIDLTEAAGVDTMNVLEKVEFLLERVQRLELELEGLKLMHHEQEQEV
jgi:uncharacterized protein with von Willebrand factor type A (vWA) domain